MVSEISLDGTKLNLTNYKEEMENDLYKISVTFKVTHEEYHDITTLLYKGKFDLKVEERDLFFKVVIQQYSTSLTNLYEKGQVGDFSILFLEVKE